MNMTDGEIDIVRRGVIDYLRGKYRGDLTWHPLFTATRDWFCYTIK